MSEELLFEFKPNTFDQLRQELSCEYPKLFDFNEIIQVDSSLPIAENISFEECKITYPFENFYMSDIVSKNSVTMAKCVDEIMIKPLLEKSA